MEYGKSNEFYVFKSIVILYCSKIRSLVRNNAMLNTMTISNARVSLWMVILPCALQRGKASPNPEEVSIQMRTNSCPSHDRNNSM